MLDSSQTDDLWDLLAVTVMVPDRRCRKRVSLAAPLLFWEQPLLNWPSHAKRFRANYLVPDHNNFIIILLLSYTCSEGSMWCYAEGEWAVIHKDPLEKVNMNLNMNEVPLNPFNDTPLIHYTKRNIVGPWDACWCPAN